MGLKVFPNLSPRLVLVNSPETEITMQELHNQLREWEELRHNLSFEEIIYSSGKDYLDENTSVGITLRLLNAVVGFEPRFTSVASGIITSECTPSRLIDPAATFVTDGITTGATIVNLDDQSGTTVLEVVDENTLSTFTLKDGLTNNWTLGDHYKIWNEVQCNLSGGNLTARDSASAPISPVFPTFGVQLIKTSSSSATLQEAEAIQYASFAGCVTVDALNGSSGTSFPYGTAENPVNNILDAITIAEERGFHVLQFIGDFTFENGTTITSYTLRGQGLHNSTFTFETGSIVAFCTIEDAKVTGVILGATGFCCCHIEDLSSPPAPPSNLTILIRESVISGSFATVANFSGLILLLDCWSTTKNGQDPVLDLKGAGCSVHLRNHSGTFTLQNCTNAAADIRIFFTSGSLILDSTVTNGTIILRGVGTLQDNSTGSTSIDSTGLISNDLIVNAVWEAPEDEHNITDTMGELLHIGGTGTPGGTVSVSGFYFVHQNYNYDEASNQLAGLVWVQTESGVIYSPISTDVGFYDRNGSLVFSMSDSSPNSQGVFHVVKPAAGLVVGDPYFASTSVVVTSGLIATGNFAMFPGVTISGVTGGASNPFPNIIEVG